MRILKKTSRLEHQVQRAVLLACFVLGSLAIWASSYLTYRLSYDYAIRSVHDDVLPIVGPLSNALATNNKGLAEESMNLLVRNALVCKVSVWNNDASTNLVAGFPRCIHGFDVPLKSLSGSSRIGTLRVGVSYRTVFHRIYTLIGLQIGAGILILLSIVFSVRIATNRIVIYPMVRLIRHLHEIEPGSKASLPIPELHGDNELGQFVKDINCLLTKAHVVYEKEKEELAFKAEHDVLTGLYNRTSGLAAFHETIKEYPLRVAALIVLDLDRFKHINDTYGHPIGDAVLIEVSKRLIRANRSRDIVARLGGDEFLIGLVDIGAPENLRVILRRIIHAVTHPIFLGGRKYDYVGVSIGAVFVEKDNSCLEALILNADAAMYSVKRSGKNGFSVYEDGQYSAPYLVPLKREEALCRRMMENDIATNTPVLNQKETTHEASD